MKDHLIELFNACIESSSEEDLQVLQHVLKGIHHKISGKNTIYINSLLHMERKLENGICEITIPLNPLLNNSFEITHGGITATLLDTAMGTLANSQLSPGLGAVTSQLDIHYLAPGIGDSIQCRAELIHQGKKTMVVLGEAFRSDGTKIAHATGSFIVINTNKTEGPK